MGHSLGSADNIHSTRTGTVNRPARYGFIPCGHRGCAKPFAPPANAIKEQAVWVWQNYSRCPRKCLGVLHQCGPSTCTPLPAQTHPLAWECMHRMMPPVKTVQCPCWAYALVPAPCVNIQAKGAVLLWTSPRACHAPKSGGTNNI